MMPIKSIIILISFLFVGVTPKNEEKIYKKNYYENGKLKSEGWLRFNVKTDYWKFYHENGKISEQGRFEYGKREQYWFFYDKNRIRKEEGNYKQGARINWWLFYDKKGRINHKCQLSMGVKNGYCLKYVDEELISVEKYNNGKKTKKWTSFGDFKKENNLSDLK